MKGVVVANTRAVVVVHVGRLNVVGMVVVVVGKGEWGRLGWLGTGCGEAGFTKHCRRRGGMG